MALFGFQCPITKIVLLGFNSCKGTVQNMPKQTLTNGIFEALVNYQIFTSLITRCTTRALLGNALYANCSSLKRSIQLLKIQMGSRATPSIPL